MKRILPPLVFVVLLLAACGEDVNEVGTASGDGVDEPASIRDESAGGDDTVITDIDIVDPQVTTPSEVVVNPDNPMELWVRWVGGDPNCTAAEAILLTETPEQINIELTTGITQDALARSCVADEFNLRVEVALNEPATGKSIAWTQAAGDEAPLVTPDLSTDDFLGLTEDEVAAIADENLIQWRIVAVDGEFFAVTEDFSPGRLNVELEDGVVTAASLG